MADGGTAEVATLTGAFADLVGAFGIRRDPAAAADELRRLVSAPWLDQSGSPRRRSLLTESGIPFEFSLKLDEQGELALRYVVDTADLRHGLLANRDRYLRYARTTTAAREEVLQALFRCHLDGALADAPPRVMHGVGFAGNGQRRASLYFPTTWLPPEELARRMAPQVPAMSPAVPPGTDRVEVVGYDFTAGELVRCKTYAWLPVARAMTAAGDHPDLRSAAVVCEAFASWVPPQSREHALFLQRTVGEGDAREKLFFFSRPWGWSTPVGLARMLGLLDQRFELHLRPLLLFRSILSHHGLRFTLGLVAIGGDDHHPSVTFYFWPARRVQKLGSG
jgi:hypothetical protein